MRHDRDAVGVVLSRGEIWLLLHALNASAPPALGWDGNPVEPWAMGELRATLRDALNPDPLRVEGERPVITIDSTMGWDLVRAGVKPLVVAEAFDIGSLFAACAERGWGAELAIPRGASPVTPANATVHVGGKDGTGGEQDRTFVGLERPVVALARALIGALDDAAATEGPIASETADDAALAQASDRYEEYVIHVESIQHGKKDETIARMARQGWELVRDEGNESGARLIFRRPNERTAEISRWKRR